MKTILILLIAILLSCKGHKNAIENDSNKKILLDNISKAELIEILEDSLTREQLDLSILKILNKERSFLKSSSLKDTTICKDWNIKENKLKHIIKSSTPISTDEWHYAFDVLPCELVGQIQFKNEIYDFSINSGSWIDIGQKNGEAIRMGYFEKEESNLFLSQPNLSKE